MATVLQTVILNVLHGFHILQSDCFYEKCLIFQSALEISNFRRNMLKNNFLWA